MSTNNVKFRTKFRPFLACESGESFWKEKFDEFLSLSPKEASQRLFSLHMRNEESLANKVPASMEFEHWIAHMPLDTMSTENAFTKLANELVHQYRQNTDENFLQREIPSYLNASFTKLREATNEAVAVTVYDNCKAFLSIANNDVQRALYLLKNNDEAYYFGGIRNIGFTAEEATSLKGKHMLIAIILEKMAENKTDELPTARSPHKATTNSDKPQQPVVPTNNSTQPSDEKKLELKFVLDYQKELTEVIKYPQLFAFIMANHTVLSLTSLENIEHLLIKLNDAKFLQEELRKAYNK